MTPSFLVDLNCAPWSVIDCFEDVDDKLNAFNLLFNPPLDYHAPIKKVKLRSRPNPCVTDEIRSLIRTRNYWRKIARKTNDPLAWAAYRNFKREVKLDLRLVGGDRGVRTSRPPVPPPPHRLAEREHVENQIINNPNNPRCVWKTIRSCIPRKSVNRKSFSDDDHAVAKEFSEFFTSIGQNTVDKIYSLANECSYDLTQPSFVPRCYLPSQQFSFRPVDCGEVEKAITSMPSDKARGIDKISIRVIKRSLPAISPSVTSIINESLASSAFPMEWKTAEVIPVLKGGDHEKPNNYRPISLLPVLSKLCERIALNQLMPYLVANDRLSVHQSGNKKWHSTETSLIHTSDRILTAVDQKKTSAVVLLDMSKAFDSVNHNILVNKLQDIGLSPSAIQWFRSYLSDRYQAVRINTAISEPLLMRSGVPQGSILGPLLFTVYANDLPSIPQHCSTDCYVDDTKLLMSFQAQDCEPTMAMMNDDLIKLRDWSFDDRLLLNPDKTKLIVYGNFRSSGQGTFTRRLC